MKLDDIQNRERYAIVSVGYNRLSSQRRLLESLKQADYSHYDNVPLVISIDCSGDEALYKYVREFEWTFGDKHVLIHEKRKGLKEHILFCGDLTQYFKGIILLEDDLYVAKDFYNYTVQMDAVYGNCDKVASVALYSNEMNGFCWLPLNRLHNEADVFADQSICSWGEFWNARMWREFRDWFKDAEIKWENLDMPIQIKQWERAWSKFFYAYMIENDKFSIYPHTALSTNFSDAGEHGDSNNTIVQVSLQQGCKQYATLPFEQLVKYDVYSNNIGLSEVLGIPINDICLDLYGIRPNDFNRRYFLTVKKLPYKVLRSFGLYMRPHELNVIEDIPGNDIFLYDTTQRALKPKGKGAHNRFLYHLHGFNYKYMPAACWAQMKVLVRKAWNKYIK